MKIETGTPAEEGRYVVFSRCRSSQVNEWCEPSIATWQGDKWHFRWPVLGWIGPLPAIRACEIQREYDL